MRRLITTLSACALVLAACGGSSAETSTTTESTTTTLATTTTESTTTTSTTSDSTTSTTYAEGTTVTTFPSAFASPLNGLRPEEDETDLDRRGIGVKVDNHINARPQSGVMDADLVAEIRVEAGITRFIAFFHDNDSEYVGPIRSLRPTDSTIARAMNVPLAISGGQPWVQSLAAGRGVGLIGPGVADMFRVSGRPAPHDLFGTTEDIRAGADAQGYADDPPTPLYSIVEWDYPDEVAEHITFYWSEYTTVEWEYAASEKRYYRIHDGAPHETITRDGERTQISAEVLVVLAGEFYTAYPSGSGSAVPATDTIGSGAAYVFARGRVWQGTWERSDYDEPFTLISPDGAEAGVPPGFAWVSIFPEHQSIEW